MSKKAKFEDVINYIIESFSDYKADDEVKDKCEDTPQDRCNYGCLSKDKCKCEKEGPGSMENRLTTVEVIQDLLVEDIKRLIDRVNKLENKDCEDDLEDFDEDFEEDIDCDCEEECDCEDDRTDEINDYLQDILEVFSGDYDEDDDEDDDEEDRKKDKAPTGGDVVEAINLILNTVEKTFKGVPIIFAFDGKKKTYIGV